MVVRGVLRHVADELRNLGGAGHEIHTAEGLCGSLRGSGSSASCGASFDEGTDACFIARLLHTTTSGLGRGGSVKIESHNLNFEN